jgi:hypothetical protein
MTCRFFSISSHMLLVCCLAMTGCGGRSEAGANGAGSPVTEYVVERSLEHGTEVLTIGSGSYWGGNGTLVEELAIGAEHGEDAYLFGSITAAWATDDRLYIVDSQVPVVRAFGLDGEHLFDIGSPGQGPGEYLMPTAVVALDDGTVAIAEAMSSRVNLYDSGGRFLEDWPLAAQKSALGLTLGSDGRIYTQSWSLAAGRMGIQAVGPEGLPGDILFPPRIDSEPVTVPVGKGVEMVLPFAPSYTWTFAPGGEMIAGVGDSYRFEIHRPDGSITAVERMVESIAVDAQEAEFRARLASSSLRLMLPDGRIRRGDIPGHKPAFSSFYPDRSGRLWVVRSGPGLPDPGCRDVDLYMAPRLLLTHPAGTTLETAGKPGPRAADAIDGGCWADTYTFDLFDISTGDFLGTVHAPEEGLRIPLYAEDDLILAAVADDFGTVRLKKYRLIVNAAGTPR